MPGGGGGTTRPPGLTPGGQRPGQPPGGGNANISNRPNAGGNTNISNRPNAGGNTNISNRPNYGGNTNISNRPNAGGNTNISNRPNYGGNTNVSNRANFGGNNNFTNVNVNRNNNFINNNGWAGRGAYNGYHSNWVHGSWNYHYPNYQWGAFGGGFAAGMATGALTSSLWNWGYSSYSNPYYAAPSTVVVQQPVVVDQPVVQAAPAYDYSQPINTASEPPPASTADAAVAIFDEARAAFMANDYGQALAKTNQALAQMPNDPTLHEFLALVQFAQGQYDPAAASLYAVLSTGPGWDWTTMAGLYPSVDVYTTQLRALEAFTQGNPQSASSRFVLAYHYLTQGHPTNAAAELREVVKLQPKDTLSAQLLAQLDPPAEAPPAEPAPAAPANAVPVGSLVGTWSARPNNDTAITLQVGDDGKFSWNVADKGQPHTLEGSSTFGNDLLTLAPDAGDPLVGKVAWKDANAFNFKAGGAPNDPGLSFTRTQ